MTCPEDETAVLLLPTRVEGDDVEKGGYVKLSEGQESSSSSGQEEEEEEEVKEAATSPFWFWVKLALLFSFLASLAFVAYRWLGPLIMDKELIPIIKWEIRTFTHPVCGLLVFASVAVFPTMLLPSTPSMWIAGMTFGYGYGFLLIISAAAVGVSLPYFIGHLFRHKIQGWMESYPDQAVVLRAAGEGNWFHQFRAVTLIRISPFPYILYNYCSVATRVKYGPYITGSLLGMVPEIFVAIYTGNLVKTLAEASSADKHGLSVTQIILNILGFLGTVATTVLITKSAPRRERALVILSPWFFISLINTAFKKKKKLTPFLILRYMEMEPMVIEVKEIDMEYEFDAARWYDFTRMELPAESEAAELWFHSAPSYAPSPFVTTLLLIEEVSHDKTEEDEKVTADVCGIDREIYHQHPHLNKNGPPVSNHKHNDNKPKLRAKSSIRPSPRSSTLMRPTASQLAKQNYARKFPMQVDKIHEKGLCGTKVQAAKRQKLDGGLLRKVAGTKQEMSFVHKIPKKDTTLDRNSQHTRIKLTTPHEHDFATSQRAHKIRHNNDQKLEQDSTAVYRFKARPFNRKIFDAPSLPVRKKSTPKLTEFQEFHLKTSERAMQHSSAVTKRSNQWNHAYKGPDKSNITDVFDGVSMESRRPSGMDISKHDLSEGKHVFKARPLSKKFPDKDETDSEMATQEFNFQPEKRVQKDLPTDLFSKLSIKSELKQNNGSRLRFTQAKGFKENRVNSFQAGNEVTPIAAQKTLSSAGQQIHSGHRGIILETKQRWTASRSFAYADGI
ncbi:unnamed protein product [Brassica napus]|uniref:(rape) hypothetical protein n=2 Tax=Brassica napus TaxID=3708 RepID=A0A816RCD0_BRANA|nr:unnamed protein product [Brassica napus]